MREKLIDTISQEVSNEYEVILEPEFQKFSFDFSEENLSMLQQHVVNPLPRVSKQ
jgi:hypothetical protein